MSYVNFKKYVNYALREFEKYVNYVLREFQENILLLVKYKSSSSNTLQHLHMKKKTFKNVLYCKSYERLKITICFSNSAVTLN